MAWSNLAEDIAEEFEELSVPDLSIFSPQALRCDSQTSFWAYVRSWSKAEKAAYQREYSKRPYVREARKRRAKKYLERPEVQERLWAKREAERAARGPRRPQPPRPKMSEKERKARLARKNAKCGWVKTRAKKLGVSRAEVRQMLASGELVYDYRRESVSKAELQEARRREVAARAWVRRVARRFGVTLLEAASLIASGQVSLRKYRRPVCRGTGARKTLRQQAVIQKAA